MLCNTERSTEAEPYLHRALAIDEQCFGLDHSEVATDLNNLVSLLYSSNRLAEAEPLMRRMVECFLKFTVSSGHRHPHLPVAIKNYAGLLLEMGRSQPEVLAQLNAIGKPFGIQFGGGTND